MVKYKVIAYAAVNGSKVHNANDIVDEAEFTEDSLHDLLKRGFIEKHEEKKGKEVKE